MARLSIDIRSAERVDDPEALRAIVREYLDVVLPGFAALSGRQFATEDLAAQTFDNIDAYLPPRGRLLLAEADDGALLGTAFLKRIRPDAAEIKRLYVRPAARGTGLGQRLMERVIAEAAVLGATALLLDTGQHLTASQRLYERLGFRDIPPYPESENDPALAPYLRYMQRDL